MTGETIHIGHGSPGGTNGESIAEAVAARLGAARTSPIDEGAAIELDGSSIVLSTETFMVDPLFFGGGDIGRLAVCETVNDLAVSGAVPRCLTLSLTVEQGFPLPDLMRVLDSVRAAAAEADLELLAGDVRVVRRGEVDRLVLHTTGVGELGQPFELGAARIAPRRCRDRHRPGSATTGSTSSPSATAAVSGTRCSATAPRSTGSSGTCSRTTPGRSTACATSDAAASGRSSTTLAATAGVSIEVEAHRHLPPPAAETAEAARRLEVDPLQLASGASICIVVEDDAVTEILELIRWQPQGHAAQIVGTVRERGARAVTLLRPDAAATAVNLLAEAEPPRLH